ncbi:hypothetical protein CRENBAI_019465 [Crenichthys baileyi]|uniref:Uncharacterized protein n=1 Tax=Crenichthys baileyi TaxID=28760 RepID=A0AAV9RXG8_9TELE
MPGTIISEIKVTARLSVLNGKLPPASVSSKLKAALLKPPPAVSWLRLVTSVSAGSCSRWAAPALHRQLQDRWWVGRGGGLIGQPWAMTPGNLSNETVEAAGEVATSTVARLPSVSHYVFLMSCRDPQQGWITMATGRQAPVFGAGHRFSAVYTHNYCCISPHLTDRVQSISRLSKNIAVSIGQVEVDAWLTELKVSIGHMLQLHVTAS